MNCSQKPSGTMAFVRGAVGVRSARKSQSCSNATSSFSHKQICVRYRKHSRARTIGCSENKTASSEAADPSAKSFDLATFGNAVVDVLIGISSYPVLASEHQNLTQPPLFSPGGACNALIVAARLGLSTAAIDRIGVDELGNYLIRTLQTEKINIDSLVATNERNTLSCVVLVDPKGRHTFIASNEQPTAPFDSDLAEQLRTNPLSSHTVTHGFQTEVSRAICKTRILVVDGYALDDLAFSDLAHALAIARHNGVQFWFDPQATVAHLANTNLALLHYLLSSADAIFLTQDEAIHLRNAFAQLRQFPKSSECDAPDTQTALDLANSLVLAFRNVQLVVIKRGEHGAVAVMRSASSTVSAECAGFRIPESEFRDATGAGDSLLAAMAAGLGKMQLSLHDALLLGCAAGAATCTRAGAGLAVASAIDIASILRSSGHDTLVSTLELWSSAPAQQI